MYSSVTHPHLYCSFCFSGGQHKTAGPAPKTPDLEALCLDEDSQITMENIVDDTLNLHSASDVRVVDALCLSVAIHTYVYTVHKLSIYTNIWV
jgi:hypothetical protein